ncbi:AaceriAER023Cp [[Ashbya] aceris (nom. inval.)]|nr:AaceriAER023Cp [[Ashbya] aceris (nom. inval.)]
MDSAVAARLNRLRAGFLKGCPEEDQMKRVIKPYGDATSDEALRQLYMDPDGHDLLVNLESPPISESYLGSMMPRHKKINEEREGLHEEKQDSIVEKSSRVLGTRRDEGQEVEHELPMLAVNGVSEESFAGTSVSSTVSENKDDSSQGPSKTKVTKGKSRFRSIFRKKGGAEPLRAQGASKGAARRTSLYDSSFGFEGIIDEDDDEEDNEDLDAEANKRFFYMNGDLRDSIYPDVSNNSDEGKPKPIKKGNFLDNFSLNPQANIHNHDGRHVTSQREEESSPPKLGKPRNPETDEDFIIDSFINQKDLEPLELSENAPHNADARDPTAAHASLKSGRPSYVEEDDEAEGESGLESDAASSYGASLLYSDSSASDFRPNVVMDSSADTGINPIEYLHYSVPSTRGFAIYTVADDSSSVGNKALSANRYRGSDTPNSESKDASSTLLLPKDGHNSGASDKKWPGSLQPHSKSVRIRNSLPSFIMTGSMKSRAGRQYQHKRSTSDVNRASIQAYPEPLVIKKVNVSEGKPHKSQLSSLLQKTENKADINPLEYFASVSGANLPRGSAIDLDVYIQLSKTYKKTPFSIKVKKTASVFETLGYALYCYVTKFRPVDLENDGLVIHEVENPNYFTLNIVDEDGEPFEDNFGLLERTQCIGTVSDNEVVICRVEDDEQFAKNDSITPLPHDFVKRATDAEETSRTASLANNPPATAMTTISKDDNLTFKVYMYPNTNPRATGTTINIPGYCKVYDLLLQCCKAKALDPTKYHLKPQGKNVLLDDNDLVHKLDCIPTLELIKHKDSRTMPVEKVRPRRPSLPTIQGSYMFNELTLDLGDQFIRAGDTSNTKREDMLPGPNGGSKATNNANKKYHSIYKLGITRQHSLTAGHGAGIGGVIFRTKNSSKSSLTTNTQPPNVLAGGSSYKDMFAGAYYKYKVWRRQQVSFINKHERTLAIDGDYIYIIPPENGYHWHQETGKTKSFHISQVSLVKRSKRVPEYFKIFVIKPNNEKRYYFEAVSPEECVEIVTRLQNLSGAYRMNRKIK